MTAAVAKIMAEFDALSPDEQQDLAELVAIRTHAGSDAGWEEAWAEELARRDQATDEERQSWPTAEGVFAQLRAGLPRP